MRYWQRSWRLRSGSACGTGNVRGGYGQHFLPFKKALLHARSPKLKSNGEWRVWCKSEARDANIPSTPDKIYKHDGWQGYLVVLPSSSLAVSSRPVYAGVWGF